MSKEEVLRQAMSIEMDNDDIECAINNLIGMYQKEIYKDDTFLFAIKALENMKKGMR